VKQTVFLLLFILSVSLFAESDIKPEIIDSRVPDLIDSTIAPIPGEESLLEQELQAKDSIQNSALLDTELDSLSDSIVFAPIDSGFSFGISWGFTSSDIFNSWADNQRSYKNDVDINKRDSSYRFKSRWLQEPDNQSIAFPVNISYFKRIDSLRSVTWGTNYAYRTEKATFAVYQDSTNDLLFESDSRLSHHRVDLFGSFQYRINPEYFSIDAVDATGFNVGGGVIPFSLFKLSSQSDYESRNRDTSTKGIGAMWFISVFTEKQMSETLLTRLFFNYNGSYHYGFKNHDELFSLEPESEWKESTMDYMDTFFELGFLFTFNRKTDGDDSIDTEE